MGFDTTKATQLNARNLALDPRIVASAVVPDWVPAQIVFQLGDGMVRQVDRATPFGLAAPVLGLLAALRVQDGMMRVETMLSVNVPPVERLSGQALSDGMNWAKEQLRQTDYVAFGTFYAASEVNASVSWNGWNYTAPADRMRARRYLIATFPDRSKLNAIIDKILSWPGFITGSAEVVPYSPPPQDTLTTPPPPGFPTVQSGYQAPPDWALGCIGYSARPEKVKANPAEFLSTDIGVLDTGFDPKHPFLDQNFKYWDKLPFDDVLGHGSRVAGIIAGRLGSQPWPSNRAKPMTGLLPSAKATVVQVFRPNDFRYPKLNWNLSLSAVTTFLDLLVSGLDPSLSSIRVLNCSWGTKEPTNALWESISQATKKNFVIVAAVGNSTDPVTLGDKQLYPGAFPTVINVGAQDCVPTAYKLADVTKKGKPEVMSYRDKNKVKQEIPWSMRLDCLAPGVNVYVCNPVNTSPAANSHVLSGTGTSFAAPMVTAAISFLRNGALGNQSNQWDSLKGLLTKSTSSPPNRLVWPVR